MDIQTISKAINGKIFNEINLRLNQELLRISTDSRSIGAGDIFLALRGDNFDGHNFVNRAIEQGAIAIIVEQPCPGVPSTIAQVVVKDTLLAYQDLSKWWRSQFKIPVIGITGSVGKTTTKELIAAALGTQGKVHKTTANFNNEIGVPKTLLEIKPHHDFAIIEMAMRGRGEIALLGQIAQPDIAVITNVGTAHIGRLGSREAIAAAKCELLETLNPQATAILNYDYSLLMATASKVWQGPTITYGFTGGDLQGEILDPYTLKVGNQSFQLPLPGEHIGSNFLAALAIAQLLNIPWDQLKQGLQVDALQGRSQRYTLEPDIVILDETYNAGLESMVAALDLLAQTPGQRKIAVLGTMKEQGDFAEELHTKVGHHVQTLGLDHLFVLTDDPTAQAIAAGATGINTDCYDRHDQLFAAIKQFIQPGDRLLFKASNSVGLGTIVGQLTKESS
ncbi:MAG: UDP-N-acetylmuramoyl-tripeptide--D-alanyl-D-alanine ligase [Synechococcaceae cyanobacterium RL_1_2]|nr:UDP-N-acetylmuramoyl-tripeptide--D-alanyl-D-alanine ligase [Synechococcaceae cyanobacterium RL_1_2]